jgi:uncharacterized damage-inducible protein DinB
MQYQNIGEIYAANDNIREKLISIVGNLTDEQANELPEGEKWTLAALVEHIAIVEDGMTRICGKLLAQAQSENKTADGAAKLSNGFLKGIAGLGDRKVEAPERVHPTGTQTISESIKKMEQNRINLNELRPTFEEFDSSAHTFPHPAFGELTACDWLALVGGHEGRHIKQIYKLLEKVNG